jgi:hypothetical protein
MGDILIEPPFGVVGRNVFCINAFSNSAVLGRTDIGGNDRLKGAR